VVTVERVMARALFLPKTTWNDLIHGKTNIKIIPKKTKKQRENYFNSPR
jgi:hypothetical protein